MSLPPELRGAGYHPWHGVVAGRSSERAGEARDVFGRQAAIHEGEFALPARHRLDARAKARVSRVVADEPGLRPVNARAVAVDVGVAVVEVGSLRAIVGLVADAVVGEGAVAVVAVGSGRAIVGLVTDAVADGGAWAVSLAQALVQ